MSKLSDSIVIKSILQRHGFTFSKAMGQNFLINPWVCPQMAEEGGAREGVGIIEIGAGIGVLTAELAERADKVVSIELDKRLLPILAETLADYDNVTVLNADVLKVNFHTLIPESFGDLPVAICANLPYYITSPIITNLLEERLPVQSITVMVQKEAAKRLCATPGTREVGAVTLAVWYYSEPEILFEVERSCFMPAPDVDSCVIRLNVRTKPPVELADEKLFFRVVKAAFAQRRKTLSNTLASTMGLSKAELEPVFAASGIPSTARAEQLTLQQFADLSNAFRLLKKA